MRHDFFFFLCHLVREKSDAAAGFVSARLSDVTSEDIN